MGDVWAVSNIALWILVGSLTFLVLGVIREVGGLHSRIGPPGALMTNEGLDVGDRAPDFRTIDVLTKREVEFHATHERESLLVFVSPNCTPCRRLLPGVAKGWARWQRHADIYVICEGSEEEVAAFAKRSKVRVPLLADPQASIREGFKVPATPFAYLLSTAGTVKLKGIVGVGDDIDRLIDGRARALGGREVLAPQEVTPEQITRVDGAAASTTPREAAYGQLD